MTDSYNPFKYFYIEIWQKHPIYTNYSSSNFGRIKRQDTILKPTTNKNGYSYFNIRHNNKTITLRLHRFIWECWNGTIEKGLEIDHIDTNKSNNYLTNLRLGTHKENKNNTLTKNHHSKPVVQYKDDIPVNTWNSIKEAAQALHINKSNISDCCKGNRKTVGGFSWKYLPIQ